MPKRIRSWIAVLQKHAQSWWYPPAVALLAALDSVLIVIPTDGLLVSATMLAPKRWIYIAVLVTFGSALGALFLGAILELHGLPLLLHWFPHIAETESWKITDHLMDRWGALTVFAVALSPLMQHPAIILAALAGMPLLELFGLVFAGRLIKYFFLAWISTHAPGMLNKLWGIQGELKEAGIKKE
jgi:membrane protein YqaA with SNARE-associated domain